MTDILNEAHFKPEFDYTVHQLSRLGLSLNDVQGKRFLEIGCGRDAELVKDINALEGNAFGLDPFVDESDILKPYYVDGLNNKIPLIGNGRPYEIIASHSLRPMYLALPDLKPMLEYVGMQLGTYSALMEEITESRTVAITLLTNMLESITENGSVHIYPAIDKLVPPRICKTFTHDVKNCRPRGLAIDLPAPAESGYKCVMSKVSVFTRQG